MLNLVFGFAKRRGLGGAKGVGRGQEKDSNTFSRVI